MMEGFTMGGPEVVLARSSISHQAEREHPDLRSDNVQGVGLVAAITLGRVVD